MREKALSNTRNLMLKYEKFNVIFTLKYEKFNVIQEKQLYFSFLSIYLPMNLKSELCQEQSKKTNKFFNHTY